MRKNIILLTVLSLCHFAGSGNTGPASLAKNGNEYLLGGFIPGDQTFQSLALNGSGGYAVWNDYQADDDGSGISLLAVDVNISSAFQPITVNETTDGEQRDAKLALLNDNDLSAAVVWDGNGDIFARFLNSDGTFRTGEILINETTSNVQNRPVITALSSGNVVIAWSSLGQDGSQYGVYARVLDSNGNPLTGELSLAQTTDYNQKSVNVTSVDDGGFYATWVSEQLSGITDSVDETGRIDFFSGGRQFNVVINGRKFDSNGNPASDETTLTSGNVISSNPQILNADNKELALFYSAKPRAARTDDGWDIYTLSIDINTGKPSGDTIRVNTVTYGDQFIPNACVIEGGYFVTWTTLGHDGDVEGIYGNVITDGVVSDEDFLINTTTKGRQFLSSVSCIDPSNWVVTWSGFSTSSRSLEVYAQKFNVSTVRVKPISIYGFGANFDTINVVWPLANDENVSGYRVSVDDGSQVFETESSHISINELEAGQSYQISLAYVYHDGSTSVGTADLVVSTWTPDDNKDGLPDVWQSSYFGGVSSSWEDSSTDTDGDGANNLEELLAGTDPADSTDVLVMHLHKSNGQNWLSWTTVEGGIYQLQQTSSFNTWLNVGSPRFAADAVDAVQINNVDDLSIYRIVRLK
jgi:hypothetical protein